MMDINKTKYNSELILSNEKALEKIAELKKTGKKIGLCTGSFDLLHPGHITHLESAKKLCDFLIVGIAEDTFSQNKLAGTGRPIFSDKLRAYMISKLKCVDMVIFDKAVNLDILHLVKPDVYIKGKDYSDMKSSTIIESDKIVRSYGGRMVFTDDEKLSTTDIIKHIKKEINL